MHTISILKWYQNSEENILKTRFFANLRSDQVQVGSRRTSASSVRKTPCRVSSSPTATRVLSIFANSGFQLIQPDLSCLKMFPCYFVTRTWCSHLPSIIIIVSEDMFSFMLTMMLSNVWTLLLLLLFWLFSFFLFSLLLALEMLKTSWRTRTMEERVDKIELTVLPSLRLRWKTSSRLWFSWSGLHLLATRKAGVHSWLRGIFSFQVRRKIPKACQGHLHWGI